MIEHSFGVRGIPVHCVEAGSGFPVLLLHGSGPGASSLGAWARVFDPLISRFHVFAMDLIGFGKSGRKADPPYFDIPLWLEQCREMIARIPGRELGIIGHSVSGALALKLAATEERIVKVVTTATMGGRFPVNDAVMKAWSFPKSREELVVASKTFVHDPSHIDEPYLARREKVLFDGEYGAYFSKMFEGDRHRYIDEASVSSEELSAIRCDVLMIHGRNDAGFPAESNTEALSRFIPQSDVLLLGNCGHSVAFEHPQKLLAAVQSFLAKSTQPGSETTNG